MAHGIPAATGNFGAIIGQIVFSVSESKGENYRSIQIARVVGSGISAKWSIIMSLLSLGVFGLFMFMGLLSTLLIPETKSKSLEVLSNEMQTGFVKG